MFDTNIWISELGLQSPPGSAARFFVRRHGAKVALPEVVKLEVEQNLYDHLKGFADDIRNKHRQLLTAFGRLKEILVPEEHEIRQRIQQLFFEFEDNLIEVPFSLESARASLLKVISKMPPSDKNQQFKDGVLWADCLALAQQDDVVLVTSDKAFYKERKYCKGLADSLLAESLMTNYKLQVVSTLSKLLDDIRTDVFVTEADLISSVLSNDKEALEHWLSKNGFELSRVQRVEKSLYITENSDRLFVEFKLHFDCVPIESRDGESATLMIPGDGTYIISQKRFAELRIGGQYLAFRLPDGTEKKVNIVQVYASSLIIGQRETSHTVRYKVSDE